MISFDPDFAKRDFLEGIAVKWLLTVFIIAHVSILLINYSVFVTDDLIAEHLSAILTFDRIEMVLASKNENLWIFLIFSVVFSLAKIGIVCLIYLTGIQGMSFRPKFSQLLKIVALSESVFFIPQVVRMIWFACFDVDYTLDIFYSFDWFSLSRFIDSEFMERYFGSVLYAANLFLMLNVVFSSWMFSRLFRNSFLHGLWFVLRTYGVAVIVWWCFCVLVMIYFQ